MRTIAFLLFFALCSLPAYPQDNALTDRMGRSCGDDVDSVPFESLAHDHEQWFVQLDGALQEIPPEAMIALPNYSGPPLVWRMQIVNGPLVIRCFVEGRK